MSENIFADDGSGIRSCGHPSRIITTDGLTGYTTHQCSDCDHLEAVRERRAAFDRAAFQHVAASAGLTVEELRTLLRLDARGVIRIHSRKAKKRGDLRLTQPSPQQPAHVA